MSGAWHPVQLEYAQKHVMRNAVSSRFTRSLLIGIGIALMLTLIECIICWLFNPFALAGSAVHRLLLTLMLLVDIPLLYIIPLVELIGIFLITFISLRLLALRSYVKDIDLAGQNYFTLATPLHDFAEITETTITYTSRTSDHSSAPQEQLLTLHELPNLQNTSFLLLGEPGAGKTTALRAYQYVASQQRSAITQGQRKLPIFLSLNDYGLFIQAYQQPNPTVSPGDGEAEIETETDAEADELNESAQQITLLDYLNHGNVAGTEYLRPYLAKMVDRGNCLFLCDGLDEVDGSVRSQIAKELVEILLITDNHVIISCDTLTFLQQPELVSVVDEGHLDAARIEQLSVEQMRQSIERYIHAQGKQWRHTAGQIMQLIDRSRLRYLCADALMLFTLLTIIDDVGLERGKTLDTRGQMFRTYVAQALKQAQAERAGTSTKRVSQRSDRDAIVSFLGHVAFTAHWWHSPGSLWLPVGASDEIELLAEALHLWLEQHPLPGAAADLTENTDYDNAAIANFLSAASNASLIDIVPLARAAGKQSEGCILRFQHPMLADYFVAEYLLACSAGDTSASLPIFQEMLEQLAYWCLPLAFLAGLAENPMQLSEQFAMRGTTPMLGAIPFSSSVQALLGSLIATGVSWVPPQAPIQKIQELPQPVVELSAHIMQEAASREALARLFTDCTAAGVQELRCSLFALLTMDGTEEFFSLLDRSWMLDFLFTYLRDTVEMTDYDAQLRRLCRVLWQFGADVVPTASELSRPEQGKSTRLRVAAINILGGTKCQDAVEPLLDCLADADHFLVTRAQYALERLGPDICLPLVLQALEDCSYGSSSQQIHEALLDILANFLGAAVRLSPSHITPGSTEYFQPILEALLEVFTARYAAEPEIQQHARHILVQQGQQGHSSSAQVPLTAAARDMQVQLSDTSITLLLQALASSDDMKVQNASQALQEIGSATLPALTALLDRRPSDIVSVRIIDILETLRDPSALPALLQRVGDPSPFVQQHVTRALHTFSPESIDGLIGLVLASTSLQVAERAAHILSEMGESVVEPVMQALFPIVLERTGLLVQVLVQVGNPRAVPALVNVLRAVRDEALSQGATLSLAAVLFTVGVLQALSQFADQRAVTPLIQALALPQTLLYEEAIDALSTLGLRALPGLLAALDVPAETLTTARVRRAMLGIVPFPAEALISAFRDCTDAQARQIMRVLSEQGTEAAQAVVRNLQHEQPRIRRYTQQSLLAMPGLVAVPALLAMLDRPASRDAVTGFLLKFPEAMPPLVELLGEPDHADLATNILQQFGPDVLEPLIAALDDPRMDVQDHAQHVLITLAEQQSTNIARMVQLFSISLPMRAHEVLLAVLTNELARRSIPVLLDCLTDAYLINDVSEALMRLTRRSEWQHTVLEGLLASLRMPERRRGTETALIKVGAAAVPGVGALITDEDVLVAEAAQHVLSEIGVPALSYIWAVHNDTSNPRRREVATRVLQSMPTDVIRDALVRLLSSDTSQDMTMALALLLERVQNEASLPSARQEIVPSLLEYVQIHDRERTSLRILSLLFLLGGTIVSKHLVELLYTYPEHHEQFAHAFLFLGEQSVETLREMLNDPNATTELRAEAMGILGLLQPTQDVYEYAQALSQYGLSLDQSRVVLPNQMAIALRALGGLLARGEWDVMTLQNLRKLSQEGSPTHELFSILLGWRYEPEITELQQSLQFERDARKNEIMNLTARIVQDQEQISDLESAVEQVQREHGIRSDELQRVMQDREHVRGRLHEVLLENQQLRDHIDELQYDLRQLRDANEE